MTDRQTNTATGLLEVIEAEFSKSLGRSAAEYMPRVRIRPRFGEPNWHAEIDGAVGISIFGPFLQSLDRVRAAYDLKSDDRDDDLTE